MKIVSSFVILTTLIACINSKITPAEVHQLVVEAKENKISTNDIFESSLLYTLPTKIYRFAEDTSTKIVLAYIPKGHIPGKNILFVARRKYSDTGNPLSCRVYLEQYDMPSKIDYIVTKTNKIAVYIKNKDFINLITKFNKSFRTINPVNNKISLWDDFLLYYYNGSAQYLVLSNKEFRILFNVILQELKTLFKDNQDDFNSFTCP